MQTTIATLIAEIGKMSRSDAGRLGALKTVEGHKLRFKKMREDYEFAPHICPYCHSAIPYEKRESVYCSHSALPNLIF